MASVNQTRPHRVNQMGKTHSKALAAWHVWGTAWARHDMCETALGLHAHAYTAYYFYSLLSWCQVYNEWPSIPGLFSRTIAQSGCALNPWAFHTASEARRRAFRFGEVLGCKTNESKELAEFLRTVPTQQLVEILSKAMSAEVRESKSILLLGGLNFRPFFIYRTQIELEPKKRVVHA